MRLYHYTSTEVLTKIVENKKLWLSSLSYLNDKHEIAHGLHTLLSMLRDEEKDPKTKEIREMFANRLDQFRNNPVNIFGFSLTPKGNILSQWRGYTKPNTGISIGFNAEKLAERASKSGIVMEKCVYKIEEHLSIVKDMVIEFEKEYKGGTAENYAESKIGWAIQKLSKLKTNEFHEEEEYRLISKYYSQYHPSSIKYRSTDRFFIPYVELDIENLNGDGKMFESIIIGPRDYVNHDINSISQYLSSKNESCGITNSISPIRW
jgi:hypothetical protein